MNNFTRILLALEPEQHFKEVARHSQTVGGKHKLPPGREASRCNEDERAWKMRLALVGSVGCETMVT